MARRYSIDDSEWDEVLFINGYAMFMGYLMMGVRGLGVLIVTWTTVVLLRGFVSVLGKKDFWCLTGIMLVQTAGVFNFLLKEKISDFVHSWWGLLAAVFAMVITPFRKDKRGISTKRAVLAVVLSVIQVLVLAIILCPIAVLYVLELYLSAGVSLWRLIEHDFGNADGGTNLEPALEALYILAVAQGVFFGYKTIHAFGAKIGLAELVVDEGSLLVDKKLVSDYLKDTVAGCEKDPSFANGKNFVTYAVDLIMEAKSNDGFIAGVRILGAVIKKDKAQDQRELAKRLLTKSASTNHLIQRLLETLGPRSPYSREIEEYSREIEEYATRREIEEYAARIVALVAHDFRLKQFPRGIQCISSLMINPFVRKSPESDSDPLHGYEELFLQGLNILHELAVDEDNRRVISNTDGLLSKITMAPLLLDALHRVDHDKWCSMAKKSWELTDQLVAALGDTGTKLRLEISNYRQPIIRNLESILECLECALLLKRQAVYIILDMYVDTSSVVASGSSSRMFIWILLLIFLLTYDSTHQMESSDIRKLAGEMLTDMLSSNHELSAILPLQSEGSATSMLQSVRVSVGDLTRTLIDAGNSTDRAHAAQILEHLCDHHSKYDKYHEEVKKASVDVMPKVIREILGCGSTREEIQEVTEADDTAPIPDLEKGGVPHDHGQEKASSSHQQNRDNKLRKALVSLCYCWSKSVCYNESFKHIASKICSEQGKTYDSFNSLLEEEYSNIKDT